MSDVLMTFAALKANNNQVYQNTVNQFRRDLGVLRYLRWEQETVNGLITRQVVNSSGIVAGTIDPDGGALQGASFDPKKMASATIACFSAAVGITDAQKQNSAHMPQSFQEGLLMKEIGSGMAASLNSAAKLFYTGQGTGNDPSGMYKWAMDGYTAVAGLSNSDLKEWGAYIDSAASNSHHVGGGTTRTITQDLLEAHMANRQVGVDGYAGAGTRPNLAVASPLTMVYVRKALKGNLRQLSGQEAAQQLVTFPSQLLSTGMQAFEWNGCIFLEDVNCRHDNLSLADPTACVIFLDTNHVKMVYSAPAGEPLAVAGADDVLESVAQDLGPALSQVQFKVRARGRTATQDIFDVATYATPFADRRDAISVLCDLTLA